MEDDEVKKQLWITALRLLAATPKSRKTLQQKLTDRGFPFHAVAEALGKMEADGLLDDRKFGRDIVSRFRYSKPSGKRKIAFELKRRSIPPPLAEELLGEVTSEEEALSARELANDQWIRLQSLPVLKRKKKIYDFLARRGFDFQICREVLEEIARQGEEE